MPQSKVQLFFQKVDKTIENINKQLPLPKNLPRWYWSEFNIPNSSSLVSASKLIIPNDIYRLTKKIEPHFTQFASQIKISDKIKDFYPRAKFDKKSKSVTIESFTQSNIYNVLIFAHELGRALAMLKLANKGIDPYQKSIYWEERQAYKFQFQFEELAFSEKVKNTLREITLRNLLVALFQHDIYTNPHQDFDQAYARSINRIYPNKSKQDKNPFYVLENILIFRPGKTIITAIIENELLSSPNA